MSDWVQQQQLEEQEYMNVNEAFPSNYLKASDLKGRKIAVQIGQVTIEKVGQDTKPIVYFDGKEKGLVLNKTNAMIISAGYGPESDGWIGKTINLYSAKVNFQNQMVDALRVELPPPPIAEEGEDSIPF